MPTVQTPVFVLSDLDLGMTVDDARLHLPDKPFDRGKVPTRGLDRLGRR